jgi:hypothetical protein
MLQRLEVGKLIDELESLKDDNALEEIIFLLDEVGNTRLRDDYIDKFIGQNSDDMDSQVYFRSMQGKIDLLDPLAVEEYLAELKRDESWSQVGRTLKHIGRGAEAAEYYLRDILESLSKGNTFSAAFYLKELSEEELHRPLFERAYKESRQRGEVWWEYRALQELELDDEIESLFDREGVKDEQELLQRKDPNRDL